MKITPAKRRILELVRDGKCQKHYRADGNTMSGAHPATLHALENAGLIKDGPGVANWYRMILTKDGEKILDSK